MQTFSQLLRVIAVAITLVSFAANDSMSQPGWLKQAMSIADTLKFDNDAPAVIIVNNSSIKIDKSGNATSKIRKAYKVLKHNGGVRTILSVAQDPLRSVKSLKGWRVRADGSTHKLKKEYIVEIGLQEAAGYYDDQNTLVATFPEIETGDVIAYEYNYKDKSGWEGYFQKFIFQTDLPVISSLFKIEIPKGWELGSSEQYLKPATRNVDENNLAWTAGFLSYRPDEPYMSNWSFLSRHVVVSCYEKDSEMERGFKDWRDVVTWAELHHRGLLRVNEGMKSVLSEISKKSTTKIGRIAEVARWVQENVRYVALELGPGRYRPRSADVTFKNKFGDCKDKATLMRAMMAALDIRSQPVLASIGSHVDVNFPSPGQFNHEILCISLDSSEVSPEFENAWVNGWLYFDPTDPATTIGNLPTSLGGTRVLRISETDSSLVRLPELKPEQRRRFYSARAEILPDYSLKAEITIKDYQNSAAESRYRWRSTTIDEQIDKLQEKFSESMQNTNISDFTRFESDDSTWVTFTLSGDSYLNISGNIYLLKADFFHPDRKNRLTKKNRVHPIFFSGTMMIDCEIEWVLPEGLEVSGKLDSIATDFDNVSVTCTPQIIDGGLIFRSQVVYDGFAIAAEDYKQAQRFEKKLKSVNRLRIFLAKK